MTVTIVDYGLGNLGSVVNILKRVGATSRRATTAQEIIDSDRVLLPGVGAFDTGMGRLADAGLTDALKSFASTGRPLLGICLGMQLLLDSSGEGEAAGLGLIPGRSIRFPDAEGVRVPHMGWNTVTVERDHALTRTLPEDARFYFVHSYRVVPDESSATLAATHYGVDFASMIQVDNVMGAQFHPEKSHSFGMTILKNFASI